MNKKVQKLAKLFSMLLAFFTASILLVEVAKAAPDLTVKNVTGFGTFATGKTITFSADVQNIGDDMDFFNSYGGIRTGHYVAQDGETVYEPLAVSGNYAYVGSSGAGDTIEVFDISNPSLLQKVGGIKFSAPNSVKDIAIKGSYLYAASYGGFTIINISSPSSPKLVKTITSPSVTEFEVELFDKYALLTGTAGSSTTYFKIFDVSDPANPIKKCDFILSNQQSIRDVEIIGNYAYLVGDADNLKDTPPTNPPELRIFNISNPSSPSEVGSLELYPANGPCVLYCNYGVRAIAIKGNYAYLGADDQLIVVDISNPASPIEKKRISISRSTQAQILENFLYIAKEFNGIDVYDISDPINIVGIGSIGTKYTDGYTDLNANRVYGLFLNKDFLYATRLSTTSGDYAKFDIYEPHTFARVCIDNPNCQKSTIGRVGGNDIDTGRLLSGASKNFTVQWTATIGNHTAYFCSDVSGNGKVYESNESNNCVSVPFTVVDIPMPDIVTQNINALTGVVTGQSVTFSADVFNKGTADMNTTNSYGLTSIGSAKTFSDYSGYDIARYGNYIYVAEYSSHGLEIFDVSDPGNITEISTVTMPTSLYPNQIEIVGNYAYVACQGYIDNVRVYNLSNPANPTLEKTLSTVSPGVETLKIAGNYMYVSGSNSTASGSPTENFEIFDISNRANPVKVGNIKSPGGVYDMAVSSSYYAYLGVSNSSTGYSKLVTYDVSNPAAPVKKNEFDLADFGLGENRFNIVGQYMYIGKRNNDFEVYSLANPENPVKVSGIDIPGTSYAGAGLSINSPYAYVGNNIGYSGFTVFDISNLLALKPVRYVLGQNQSSYATLFDQRYVYTVGLFGHIDALEPHVFSRVCIDNPSCLTTTTGRIGTDIDAGLLTAGGIKTVSANADWTATAGNHTVYFCSDVSQQVGDAGTYDGVSELDEINNCISRAFTVSDSRTYFCPNKPEPGTEWNTVSAYTQTWNAALGSFVPADSSTEYNVTPSTTSCHYKCASGYSWDGSTCAVSSVRSGTWREVGP